MNKPSCLGHHKRIKENYKSAGFNGWLDYEALEFALSYAIPRKDTKSIAKELISKFKTLNNVLDADLKELGKITGISEHTAFSHNHLCINKIKKRISKFVYNGECP